MITIKTQNSTITNPDGTKFNGNIEIIPNTHFEYTEIDGSRKKVSRNPIIINVTNGKIQNFQLSPTRNAYHDIDKIYYKVRYKSGNIEFFEYWDIPADGPEEIEITEINLIEISEKTIYIMHEHNNMSMLNNYNPANFEPSGAVNTAITNHTTTYNHGNIGKIKDVEVDDTNKANNRILVYNATSQKFEYQDKPQSATWGSITGALSNQTDLQNALDTKQDLLVSGTNIKTINNQSILGSGDIKTLGGISDVYSVNSGTSITIDPSLHNFWNVTITDNTTITILNGTVGSSFYLLLQQGTTYYTIRILGAYILTNTYPRQKEASLYRLTWNGLSWSVEVIANRIAESSLNMLTYQWSQNIFINSSPSLTFSFTNNTHPLVQGVYYHTSFQTNNYIYVIGGYTGSGPTNKIQRAPINEDGTLGTWTEITPSFPINIMEHQCFITKNRVYVIGGHNGINALSSIYTATINSDGTIGSFSLSPVSLPIGLYDMNVFLLNNKVAICGGWGVINGYVNSNPNIYTIDIQSDGTLGTLSSSYFGIISGQNALAVTKNRVYFCGGIFYNNGALSYNTTTQYSNITSSGLSEPITISPTTFPTTSSNRMVALPQSTLVLGDKIFILGYSTGTTTGQILYASYNEDTVLSTFGVYGSCPTVTYSNIQVTNGHIHIIGGFTSSASSTVYTSPFLDSWTWYDPHSAFYSDNNLI